MLRSHWFLSIQVIVPSTLLASATNIRTYKATVSKPQRYIRSHHCHMSYRLFSKQLKNGDYSYSKNYSATTRTEATQTNFETSFEISQSQVEIHTTKFAHSCTQSQLKIRCEPFSSLQVRTSHYSGILSPSFTFSRITIATISANISACFKYIVTYCCSRENETCGQYP